MKKEEAKETLEVSEKSNNTITIEEAPKDSSIKGRRSRKKNEVITEKKSKKKEKVMVEAIDEVRLYETMVILDPDLKQKKIEEKVEEIKKLITSSEGKITFDDQTWGIRPLCYKIKRKWHGYYFVLNFKIKASAVKEINGLLEIDPLVLRFLMVKLPEDFKSVKFEDCHDKYEVESFEETQAKREEQRKKKRMSFKKVVVKKEEKKGAHEPIVAVSKEEPKEEIKKEESIIKKDNVKSGEVKGEEKEIKKTEEVEVKKGKPEAKVKVEEKEETKEEPKEEEKKKEEVKKEGTSDDHLKELNEKLDKLLLSDDLDSL